MPLSPHGAVCAVQQGPQRGGDCLHRRLFGGCQFTAAYKFSFRQGGLEQFYAHLERTLRGKLWERPVRRMPTSNGDHRAEPADAGGWTIVGGNTASNPSNTTLGPSITAPTAVTPNPHSSQHNASAAAAAAQRDEEDMAYLTMGIGLARVVQVKERRTEEAQAALAHQREQALTDVAALIRNATKLVSAIGSLRAQQRQQTASGGGGDASDPAAAAAREEIVSIEAALGIGTIVNNTAGSAHNSQQPLLIGGAGSAPLATFKQHPPASRTPRLYAPAPLYASLAHEILSWMTHPKNILSRRCLFPLTELYALYNKARSGEAIVSTADFLEAVISLSAISIKNAAARASSQALLLRQRQQQQNGGAQYVISVQSVAAQAPTGSTFASGGVASTSISGANGSNSNSEVVGGGADAFPSAIFD